MPKGVQGDGRILRGDAGERQIAYGARPAGQSAAHALCRQRKAADAAVGLKDLWVDWWNKVAPLRRPDFDRLSFEENLLEQRISILDGLCVPVTASGRYTVVVASLPRPGGNLSGFISTEAGMAGKWLQLLTEIAPGVKRAAMIFNPDTAAGGGSVYLPAFEVAARSFKVAPITTPVHSDAEIEAVMTSLGREPGGGLVVMPDAFMQAHRAPVILLAARNNVPAVYWNSDMAREGGLLSYGPNLFDQFRRAAPYVDRILHGAKPADLPVQLPTKFEMAVNLKTAKALGLTVPQSILLQADEVIE